MEKHIIKEEIWEYPGNKPIWKTNFRCILINNGNWNYKMKDLPYLPGKWIFKVSTQNEHAPTFADQNNFMSGLLEVEWRNDNFKFPDGSGDRCTKNLKNPTYYFKKRLKIFQQTLDFYNTKYNGQTKLI